MTEAVLALALCHNVTPVYEDEEGEDAGESDIPEADQERNEQRILTLFAVGLKI